MTIDSLILSELEQDPSALVSPIVRNGSQITVGADEAVWKAWVEKEARGREPLVLEDGGAGAEEPKITQRERRMIVFIWFLIAPIVLLIHGMLASEMSDSAKSKGHSKRRYFHLCFWLGIVGYLCVLAPQTSRIGTGERIIALLQSSQSPYEASLSPSHPLRRHRGGPAPRNAELPPL